MLYNQICLLAFQSSRLGVSHELEVGRQHQQANPFIHYLAMNPSTEQIYGEIGATSDIHTSAGLFARAKAAGLVVPKHHQTLCFSVSQEHAPIWASATQVGPSYLDANTEMYQFGDRMDDVLAHSLDRAKNEACMTFTINLLEEIYNSSQLEVLAGKAGYPQCFRGNSTSPQNRTSSGAQTFIH